MNIKNKVIGGRPATKIRDALRQSVGAGAVFSRSNLMIRLKLEDHYRPMPLADGSMSYGFHWSPSSTKTTKAVLSDLLQEKFIKKYKTEYIKDLDPEIYDYYKITPKGLIFLNASAKSPYPKAKAVEQLPEFIKRVIEVRTYPNFPCVIEEVSMFGAMINPEKEYVSNIDLAIKFRERVDENGEKPEREMRWRTIKKPGVEFSVGEIPKEVSFNEILKFLKKSQAIFNLYNLSDTVQSAILDLKFERLKIYSLDDPAEARKQLGLILLGEKE